MKSKLFAAGSITILLLLIFNFSCNKKDDIARTSAPALTVPDALIQSAKNWHADKQQKVGPISNNTSTKERPMLPPIWKQSELLTLKNGRTYLVVASPKVEVSTKSKIGVIRKFVFEVRGNETVGGVIVEMFAPKDYINKGRANLLEKYLNSSLTDFTGSVIYYDVNYRYMISATFKNGIRQDKVESKVMSDHGEHREEKNTSGNTALDTWETCTDWYNVAWSNGQLVAIDYITTTCTYDYSSEIGGGGYWTTWTWDGGSQTTSGGGGGTGIITDLQNPNFVALYPNPPIILKKFLDCFNLVPSSGATYKIKLSADIPMNDVPGALVDWAGNPGHSFITLTKTNGGQSITQSFGFYPASGFKSLMLSPVESVINDNGNHEYDASVELTITQAQFNAAITAATSPPFNYDLDNYNCTDWALDVFNAASPPYSVYPPDTYSLAGKNWGRTPNGLYHKLYELTMNGRPGIDFGTAYQAPASHGPCN